MPRTAVASALSRRLAIPAAWLRAVALAALVVLGGVVTAPAPARADVTVADQSLEVVTAKGRQRFVVEVVDTAESRAKGLMFRTEMAPNHGMLFDFRREELVWFWMKNTYLPLDMIFARADGTILSIAENTTPLSEAMVPSNGPVRFVLELNAGSAARLGLKAGDRLAHPRIRAGN